MRMDCGEAEAVSVKPRAIFSLLMYLWKSSTLSSSEITWGIFCSNNYDKENRNKIGLIIKNFRKPDPMTTRKYIEDLSRLLPSLQLTNDKVTFDIFDEPVIVRSVRSTTITPVEHHEQRVSSQEQVVVGRRKALKRTRICQDNNHDKQDPRI